LRVSRSWKVLRSRCLGRFERIGGIQELIPPLFRHASGSQQQKDNASDAHQDSDTADDARAGLGDAVIIAGQRPAEEIPAFLDAADLLVSPRSSGTNTPLKIYQYLRSGRAIVATRLLTHTQVLDDAVAILTEPTPEGFAAGILAGIEDPTMARGVGERARHLAETKYSYEAYLARTRQAVAHVTGAPATQVAGGAA
jgi:glycosyltransferase involved in cell wall biosynthesis